MTVNRDNPAYRWKTLLLGDVARFDVETYECSLAQVEWDLAGLEQNKRQLMTQGAQALYSHAFQVLMAKMGANLATGKEYAGETDWEFRARLRAMISAFAAEGATRNDTNHAGILSQGYRDHEFLSDETIAAGTSVNVDLASAGDATDFALWPVLLIGDDGTHELTSLEDGGPGFVLIDEVVGSYPVGARIIPLEWAVAGAYPRSPLRLEKDSRSPDLFVSPMEFQFADEPVEAP